MIDMEFVEACQQMEAGEICIAMGVKYRITDDNVLEYEIQKGVWNRSIVKLSDHGQNNWEIFKPIETLSEEIKIISSIKYVPVESLQEFMMKYTERVWKLLHEVDKRPTTESLFNKIGKETMGTKIIKKIIGDV